jgi:hypothetical protein
MEQYPESETNGEELTEQQIIEMHLMVGRVAMIFATLDSLPHLSVLNLEVRQRALEGQLVSTQLGDGSIVHIGNVQPSKSKTEAGSQARHPVSVPDKHYEIWHYRRASAGQSENYRFYSGHEDPDPNHTDRLPKVLTPRSDGRGLRSLNPSSGKRWQVLDRLMANIEQSVGIKPSR